MEMKTHKMLVTSKYDNIWYQNVFKLEKNCSVFFWLLPTLNSALKHWRASESFASVGAQIKKITYFCYLPYEHSYC